ncbi:MAG: hypothetical protein ACI9K2_002742, partial [Myxococcota bacterium]
MLVSSLDISSVDGLAALTGMPPPGMFITPPTASLRYDSPLPPVLNNGPEPEPEPEPEPSTVHSTTPPSAGAAVDVPIPGRLIAQRRPPQD